MWTKRVGNNPRIKVLLPHGRPGATHEYFGAFDSCFPGEGIEYYYYDQLGSAFSDQPKDPTPWDPPRFVEEVEQVRTALNLDSSNFYLLGHSWGGMLAIEYALKYQQNLKGLVISNISASIPAYVEYALLGVAGAELLRTAHPAQAAGAVARSGGTAHSPASTMYDDQETYFAGLVKLIEDVDQGRFPGR